MRTREVLIEAPARGLEAVTGAMHGASSCSVLTGVPTPGAAQTRTRETRNIQPHRLRFRAIHATYGCWGLRLEWPQASFSQGGHLVYGW